MSISGKFRVRHPCVRSAWGDMSKASHVGSRQRVLRLMFAHGTHCWAARSRPTLQRVPVSCGCVCASLVASWFAALCVHRCIACGPVPVPVPFPLCCERLTFGNETLGTGSGTCSRSRSVPVFLKGTTNTAPSSQPKEYEYCTVTGVDLGSASLIAVVFAPRGSFATTSGEDPGGKAKLKLESGVGNGSVE